MTRLLAPLALALLLGMVAGGASAESRRDPAEGAIPAQAGAGQPKAKTTSTPSTPSPRSPKVTAPGQQPLRFDPNDIDDPYGRQPGEARIRPMMTPGGRAGVGGRF